MATNSCRAVFEKVREMSIMGDERSGPVLRVALSTLSDLKNTLSPGMDTSPPIDLTVRVWHGERVSSTETMPDFVLKVIPHAQARWTGSWANMARKLCRDLETARCRQGTARVLFRKLIVQDTEMPIADQAHSVAFVPDNKESRVTKYDLKTETQSVGALRVRAMGEGRTRSEVRQQPAQHFPGSFMTPPTGLPLEPWGSSLANLGLHE